MFEIEKGKPIPAGLGGWGKYPWKKMEIGDSFYVPRSQMTREGYHPHPPASSGIKVSVRKEGDGVRVWRVA